MKLAQSVADVLRDHVTLEVEGIDRMYLNAVIPVLQTEGGINWFFRELRGHVFASSALMAPMTRAFVESVESFVVAESLEVVTFQKRQRKDTVAAEHRARFHGEEGLLFVGKAHEKASVFRTQSRRNPQTGASYAWLYRSTALVNQYYFYAIDRDFGPFFLKFCSYFPYNAKLCINGHEYVKRQLERRGIRHQALDNGILSCEDPAPVRTPPHCKGSATSSRRRRSMPCFGNGCVACRTPSRRRIGRRASGTTCRFCKPSFH